MAIFGLLTRPDPELNLMERDAVRQVATCRHPARVHSAYTRNPTHSIGAEFSAKNCQRVIRPSTASTWLATSTAKDIIKNSAKKLARAASSSFPCFP